jgi:hypothetical protein
MRGVDESSAAEEAEEASRNKSESGSRSWNTKRGQLVLVAAVLIAVALVPIVFAYQQLGYDADIEASGDYADPMANAEQFLGRVVHEAGANISADYAWNQRHSAVTEVHDRLQPRIAILERSRVTEGVSYHVSYNDSVATAWAVANCPGGQARQFGPCVSDRGVVVQERVGETHVLAIALDVTVTTERGLIEATVIVPVIE